MHIQFKKHGKFYPADHCSFQATATGWQQGWVAMIRVEGPGIRDDVELDDSFYETPEAAKDAADSLLCELLRVE